jgi:Rrf2 family protein
MTLQKKRKPEKHMHNKSSKTAVSVLTCLAEVYDKGKTKMSSTDLAELRGLQRPIVAKTLTILSQLGIIQGMPGPKGGYWLVKPPNEIYIHDVSSLFERQNKHKMCPFGGGICGEDDPCPLHDSYFKAIEATENFLKETTFQIFRDAYVEKQAQEAKG